MILALFWKGFTEKEAIASIITVFLCIPFFKFVMPGLDGVGIYFDKMAELRPTFVVGLTVGYLVSKFVK
jgi:Na+/proline symporter